MLVMALVYAACTCNYTGRKEGLYTLYTFQNSHVLSSLIAIYRSFVYAQIPIVLHQEVAFHKHVRLLKLHIFGIVPRPAPTTICTSRFKYWKDPP